MITGVIFWQDEDQVFPIANWIDNVNVLLGWWLGALIKLAGGADQDKFLFMEGPYEMSLKRVDADHIDIVGLRGSPTSNIDLCDPGKSFHTTSRLTALAKEVLQAGHQLHAEASAKPIVGNGLHLQGFLRAEALLLEKLRRNGRIDD